MRNPSDMCQVMVRMLCCAIRTLCIRTTFQTQIVIIGACFEAGLINNNASAEVVVGYAVTSCAVIKDLQIVSQST